MRRSWLHLIELGFCGGADGGDKLLPVGKWALLYNRCAALTLGKEGASNVQCRLLVADVLRMIRKTSRLGKNILRYAGHGRTCDGVPGNGRGIVAGLLNALEEEAFREVVLELANEILTTDLPQPSTKCVWL